MNIEIPEMLKTIVGDIEKREGKAYLVGGSVIDAI